jgi:hypothetical protein
MRIFSLIRSIIITVRPSALAVNDRFVFWVKNIRKVVEKSKDITQFNRKNAGAILEFD